MAIIVLCSLRHVSVLTRVCWFEERKGTPDTLSGKQTRHLY